MSVFGSSPLASNAAQTLAGLGQAERVNRANADAKKAGKPTGPKRGADEVDVQSAQAADAVRNASGNGDEETAENRKEKGQKEKGGEKPPRLDVQG